MIRRENIKADTVGDLKKFLEKCDDSLLLNFGTEDLGFEIDAFSCDGMSLSIESSDLDHYIKTI